METKRVLKAERDLTRVQVCKRLNVLIEDVLKIVRYDQSDAHLENFKEYECSLYEITVR